MTENRINKINSKNAKKSRKLASIRKNIMKIHCIMKKIFEE